MEVVVVLAASTRHVLDGESERNRSPRIIYRAEGIEILTELAFRDGIMDRIRLREKRFHERAYLFVLQALEYCQAHLVERRHITGRELAEACRDLALARYGVMAKLVLEHWGLYESADIGDLVFTLVDLGLLISQPTDSRDDFLHVFDFEEAFDREYPWNRAQLA